VDTLQAWLAQVATALTEASAHNEKAYVGWLMTAIDSPEPVDSIFDSGGARFHGLDSMLATAPHSQIMSGELHRALTRGADRWFA
jgi:hypothetical protein